MKNLISRLYRLVMGVSPNAAKVPSQPNQGSIRSPDSPLAVSPPVDTGPRDEMPLIRPQAARPQAEQLPPVTVRQRDTSPILAQPAPQDPLTLLAELKGQSQLLAGVFKNVDPKNLTDEQLQNLLKIFEDHDKERLLRDLFDRKEKRNQCSSSSPVGGR